MSNTINNSEHLINKMNVVLKLKNNAMINIVNDKLTLSVFALFEQNLKNAKEINFVVRDAKFVPNRTEISHEFEVSPNDILYNSYDIVEKNKLKHFAKSKAMHDFIKENVNVKKVNPRVSNLYRDRMERIDYETLSKICKLFECSVSEVLEYYEE